MEQRQKKKIAYEFGDFAEEMAAQEYIRRGYVVKEKKWRLGKIEIDLITQKENTVIIIEVKARSESEEEALLAVTLDKRKRMIKAADAYLSKYHGTFNYRFDIVAVVGNKDNFKMEIFEDAFLATDVF